MSLKSKTLWRIVVFGLIGALFVVSLFVPTLRETLRGLFSFLGLVWGVWVNETERLA